MRNGKGKPPMEIPHTIFAIRRYRFYGIMYLIHQIYIHIYIYIYFFFPFIIYFIYYLLNSNYKYIYFNFTLYQLNF